MADILCLHSSQSSGAQWRALKQELAQAFPAAQVHTPNLIGYGREPYDAAHPPTHAFRLAHEVEALLPVLEHIAVAADALGGAGSADAVGLDAGRVSSVGLDADSVDANVSGGVTASSTEHLPRAPFHLIGHSFGGAVALRLARLLCQAGIPPTSVCVYEPVCFHVLPSAGPARDEIVDVAEQMERLTTAEATAAFVNYWNQPGYFEALPAKVQQGMIAKQMKVNADFAALLHEPAQLHDYSVIDCPVLLMHGSQSPLSSRTVASLLASVLPDCTEVEVAAGHMAPLTAPELVNSAVLGFLRGL